ncbi:type IV toxin-antitoxin system AbiEi family antitoxin domain-containing protein [Rubritalea tangerina]
MEIQYQHLLNLAKQSPIVRDALLRKAGISSTVISQAVKAGELIRPCAFT